MITACQHPLKTTFRLGQLTQKSLYPAVNSPVLFQIFTVIHPGLQLLFDVIQSPDSVVYKPCRVVHISTGFIPALLTFFRLTLGFLGISQTLKTNINVAFPFAQFVSLFQVLQRTIQLALLFPQNRTVIVSRFGIRKFGQISIIGQ